MLFSDGEFFSFVNCDIRKLATLYFSNIEEEKKTRQFWEQSA
jgi:hypothetical protein